MTRYTGVRSHGERTEYRKKGQRRKDEMSDDVQEIKSRLDIAEVIGDYLPLKRKGNLLWGLCPFHGEKTPSFSVSRERQTFHCFGCGKGGDVFAFVMEQEGLSFREALKFLAPRAGVVLSTRPSSFSRESSEDRRAVLEEALAFFRASLAGESAEPARSYLLRRNLPPESWKRFEIGWAPASWDSLSRHLSSRGYTEEEAVSSGLAIPKERGAYDRFRGRVIFPVRDEMAKLRGFGGRLMDGDGAKYVNSPEGELFNKRRLLYLLNEAKKTVRERGRIILMEGYMDAIRGHMAGFTESVASLGTSLTEEQAGLIKRFTDLCYISYDADGAGREAAIRGMYVLQRRGVEVRVLLLPRGKDPDDVLSEKEGASLFGKLIEKALPLPLYHAYVRKDDLRSPGRGQKAKEDLLSGLASLPKLDIVDYIPAIAKIFRLFDHELEREISARRKSVKNAGSLKGNSPESDVYKGKRETSPLDRSIDLECAFCSLVWRNTGLLENLPAEEELLPLFTDEAVSGIITALLSGETPETLEKRWRSMGENACPERIARGDAVLSRDELGVEHIARLTEELASNASRRWYERLKLAVVSGEATDEEKKAYFDCARRLKGGV